MRFYDVMSGDGAPHFYYEGTLAKSSDRESALGRDGSPRGAERGNSPKSIFMGCRFGGPAMSTRMLEKDWQVAVARA